MPGGLPADAAGVTPRAATGLLLTTAALTLAGCGPFVGGVPSGGSQGASASDEEMAATNVRAAIPAIEAYYADNSSYAGVTVAKLRAYDYGIADIEVAVSSDGNGYCLVSTVGSATMSKQGPAGDLQPGGC